MVPQTLGPAQRPTIRLFKGAYLPYLPFIPALNQIPCKYHAIQNYLEKLRLHQPAFTPIHTHHRSTGGAGCKPWGGGGATVYIW